MPEQTTGQLNSDSMRMGTISIGNLSYTISGGEGMHLFGLDAFYRAEACDPQKADCSMRIIHDETGKKRRRSRGRKGRVFEADVTWGLYRSEQTGTDSETVMTVPALKSTPYSRVFAEFDRNLKNGTVYTCRSEEHYFFYPFLEVLTIKLLAQRRGTLLHACCIDDNGTGYLFLGESGAGKSTMANLWSVEKGITVLSDDRVLVSMTDQGLVAYGTPWHGTEKYAVNASVPVNKVFFISHADKNCVQTVHGIASVSELVKNAFLPFWDRKSMEYCTEFLIELSHNTSLFRLGVYPDSGILDLVRSIHV